MTDFINTIDVLGDAVVARGIVERSIVEYHDNNVTAVRQGALYRCYTLTNINFPAVVSVGDYAFCECSSLTSVDLHAATSIGKYAFSKCSALTSVNLPAATSIDNSAFGDCSKITTFDFPSVTSIGTNAFSSCSVFTTLILRNTEKVATLGSTYVFDRTPIKSGTGYIYVPRTLVDSYKSATNWSKYANQFRALEDYTVDGTITGELDPNKI